MSELIVAAVQMTSTSDVQDNLHRAKSLVMRAIDRGAHLLVLPENFGFLGGEGEAKKHAQSLEKSSFINPFREISARYGVTCILGGLPEMADHGKMFNTCAAIGPSGDVIAAYRKIHLFDVDLGPGQVMRESVDVCSGDLAACSVIDVQGWRVALSICYDLRFPELYRRAVLEQGAEVLLVPAAFTLHTGKDHWEVLLRARAIENQCYVVAPGQVGRHNDKRISWGKSMVVDPWGVVIAQASEGEGIAIAACDRNSLNDVRERLPALKHARLWSAMMAGKIS